MVKIPRFTFEKFPGTPALLTTSMKSVGEAMAIGRSFAEALQKGLRSMETGLSGLDEVEPPGDGGARRLPRRAVAAHARPAADDRPGLRAGLIDRGHPRRLQIRPLVPARTANASSKPSARVAADGLPQDAGALRRLKALGFSDQRLAELDRRERSRRSATQRASLGVLPVYKRIDTCAAEFASATPYMYSTYEGGYGTPICEADPTDRDKVIILGGGPNRIGQGIEFDYCCVHAAYALKEAGFETIMVNCNPETVRTDYDTSDRLYFEPLTAEDVIALVRREQQNGTLLGCIVQYGGQTPLKLVAGAGSARESRSSAPRADAIDLAEDRERFQQLLQRLGLRQPENGIARSADEAEAIAERIGYPGGDPAQLRAGRPGDGDRLRPRRPAPLHARGGARLRRQPGADRPLSATTRSRSTSTASPTARRVYVAGVMEHIEEAGIHSGDSRLLAAALLAVARDGRPSSKAETEAMAKALGVVGLMNVQYAIKDDDDLRAGGEPARLAHRAVRRQGDRRRRSPRSARA